MRILMVVLALAIYGGLTYYMGWAVKSYLQAMNVFRWPALFWIVVAVLALSYVIGRMHPALSVFTVIGSYWFFVVQYGLILITLALIVIKVTPLSVQLVGSVAVGIFVVLFALGSYFAYSPVTRELTVNVNKAGEDMRIVMASDFHLGLLSNKAHLKRFVKLSNEANPDIVLLAGDIVDDDPRVFIEKGMDDELRMLRATYGVYGILGNHEYYGNEIPAFKEAMAASNVQILMDETITVENRFVLTGREDLTNKARLPLEQLAPESSDLPWIVMNHTPDDLQTPASLGADIHVSGHTHKGQMWPNVYITDRLFDLDYGHELFEQMHGIVSSGFGFWGPPMRIGSRAELWVIDVHFTK